jgi:hypothetical protein
LIGRFENHELPLRPCQREKAVPPQAAKPEIAKPKRTTPNRNWMKHFVVGDPEKAAQRKHAQSSPAGSP